MASEPEPEPEPAVGHLRPIAEEHGSIDPPATEADLQSLVASLRAESESRGDDEGLASLMVQLPAVPPAVAALWLEGRSWHFSRDHYDAFGFNIFQPSCVVQTTEQIFGDWENRAEWMRTEANGELRQAGQPTVAGPGWVCLASLSEYDYLFCCFDSASASFGHVRHMVNNCCEEWHAADSFAVFPARLLEWHTSGADEDTLSECSPRPARPAR